MKISSKLSSKIRSKIYNEVFDYLCLLDEKDRSLEISHEAWQSLHKRAGEMISKIQTEVLAEIAFYKR